MSSAAPESKLAGPDFLCVGAQKAGTGWLYDQLRNHPDFWLPPMKELHYFDRLTAAAGSFANRSLPLARREQDRFKIARQRARDKADREFLDHFEQLHQQTSIDFPGYARLFESKHDLIAGDITPGYSILDDTTVRQIGEHFPGLKVIFLARDPVERVWSQISMYIRRELIEPFDPNDVQRIDEHLRRPEIVLRSYPSRIVRRWRQLFGSDRFRVFFFDDLKRDPAKLRHEIITLLGGDPQKQSGELAPWYNPKAEKTKLTLTPAARTHLAQFFDDELRACATELGGPAADWPNRYL